MALARKRNSYSCKNVIFFERRMAFIERGRPCEGERKSKMAVRPDQTEQLHIRANKTTTTEEQEENK